jgi:hypothetical protein
VGIKEDHRSSFFGGSAAIFIPDTQDPVYNWPRKNLEDDKH